jgi:hypothetical protein
LLSLLGEADDGDMPSSLDSHRQFTLMPHAIAGNPTWNNTSSLRQKVPKKSGILKINRRFLQTKSAGTPPLEQPSTATTTSTVIFISIHHCLLIRLS